MSPGVPSGEDAEPSGALRVRATFKVSGEQTAQAIAARLVDRAQEIANMPDCECDLDVSVEWDPPDGPSAPVETLARQARGRDVER